MTIALKYSLYAAPSQYHKLSNKLLSLKGIKNGKLFLNPNGREY